MGNQPAHSFTQWFFETIFQSPLDTISKLAIENGVTAAFMVVSLLLLYQYFSRRIRNLGVCSETQFMRIAKLEQHKLFESCDYWLQIGIYRINFPAQYPVKAKLYRDLLTVLIQSVNQVCQSRTTSLRTAQDSFVWRDIARATLTDIVKGYEQAFLQQGTPEIVIQKFRQWHQGSLDYVLHNIESLGDSTIASTEHKTAALFSAILSSTKTAFYDAERTLITLNGELSGQQYQGESIE